MQYDLVIIGAGPSGLAAAARLTHFGVKVCLIERHHRLGGLNSWHHIHGREVSTGLHAFTNYNPTGRGGPLGKLLRQLRLSYSDLDLRPQTQSSIRFPSTTLKFSNDPELIRQQIATAFPAAIDGFDRFRALVRTTDEGELTLRQTSTRQVLHSFIADPLLREMLLCPVSFYGNPGGVGDGQDSTRIRPDMDWLSFCVVWKCIFETGLAYPAAGIRPLWESLAKRIVNDEGVLRLSTSVEKLRVSNGRVIAAVTNTGEEITAEMFLSSAGGKETAMLLGQDAAEATRHTIGSISVVEGIARLQGTPTQCGMEDATIFYSLTDALEFRRPDALVQPVSGVLCAPDNYQGIEEGIIKISQLASYPAWRKLTASEYISQKQRAGEEMAQTMGKLGITIRKPAEMPGKFGPFDDMFTPLTLQRYTQHCEGAIYGSPVKSRTGETPCANLFLIGADQGFQGIVGAMLSGVAMANLHYLTKHT